MSDTSRTSTVDGSTVHGPSVDGHSVCTDGALPPAAELHQLRAELAAALDKIVNLEVALVSGRRIGAAVGILMVQRRLTETEAFTLLRTVSKHQHRKLREIAEDVLYTGALSHAHHQRSARRQNTDPRPAGAAEGGRMSSGDQPGPSPRDAKGSAVQAAAGEPAASRVPDLPAVDGSLDVLDRREHPVDGNRSPARGAELTVIAAQHRDQLLLAVTGELDVQTTELFTACCTPAVVGVRGSAVELDLSAVTFLDCAGLGGLIGLRATAAAHGRSLRIARTSPRVARLLTLAGLDNQLDPTPPHRA